MDKVIPQDAMCKAFLHLHGVVDAADAADEACEAREMHEVHVGHDLQIHKKGYKIIVSVII